MNQTDNQLLQLFSACDTDGSGFIGNDEVRDICAKFGISAPDADAIFEDLDRDGDGKISFEDFQAGFDDYEKSILCANVPLSPGFRKSAESLENIKKVLENEANIRSTEKKITDFDLEIEESINFRRPKTLTRQISVKGEESHLMVQDLIENVKKLKDENSRLANSWMRDKKEHEEHLQHLEEEMDSQVKEVEFRVKLKAKEEIEAERKSLREVMKDEMDELQAHLSMFEKVDLWLKANQSNQQDEKLNEFRTKLEEAVQENRQMRFSLMDTQTTVSLMRSDLAQIRSQYQEKCSELGSERERTLEALHEQEHLSRQLHMLQDANRRLQDTNDTLRVVDIHPEQMIAPVMQLPKTSTKKVKRGSVIGDYIGYNTYKDIVSANKPLSEADLDAEGNERDLQSRCSHESYCSAPTGPAWGRRYNADDEIDSGLSSNIRDDESELQESYSRFPGSPHHLGLQSMDPKQRANESMNSKTDGMSHVPSTKSIDDSVLTNDTDRKETLDGQPHEPTIKEPTGPPERAYKVIFIGDASVGKSSFIVRVTKNSFVPQLSSTLGVDFQVRTMSVDGKNVALQLWDTAGQERFRSITKSYFRKADGIMLLYDVSNEHSFLHVREWMSDVEELTSRTIPVMIVGNKTDLRESSLNQQHFVKTQTGIDIAQEYKAEFLEASVKDGSNIISAVGRLILHMMDNEDKMVKNGGMQLTKDKPKRFKCCNK